MFDSPCSYIQAWARTIAEQRFTTWTLLDHDAEDRLDGDNGSTWTPQLPSTKGSQSGGLDDRGIAEDDMAVVIGVYVMGSPRYERAVR